MPFENPKETVAYITTRVWGGTGKYSFGHRCRALLDRAVGSLQRIERRARSPTNASGTLCTAATGQDSSLCRFKMPKFASQMRVALARMV